MNSPKIIPFSYENMFSLTNCFLRIGLYLNRLFQQLMFHMKKNSIVNCLLRTHCLFQSFPFKTGLFSLNMLFDFILFIVEINII